MKTDKDWEARARELWGGAVVSFPQARTVELNTEFLGIYMLQLGREMASYERGECYSELGTIEASWRERIAKARAEAADARAEEIAKRLEAQDCSDCTESARVARSTITKPKTRERVLEEALRAARHDAILLGLDETRRSIERALEWKP